MQIKFLETLSESEYQVVNWSVILTLLIVALLIALPAMIRIYKRWRLQRKIRNLGIDSLHYVNLPDGLEGYLFYEHIILSENGIAIYGLVRYRGNVFAADKIDVWTQVEDNRSYKFPNPLLELESKKIALKAQYTEVPVTSGVLVARDVCFPKGKPENVYLLDSIAPVSNKNVNPVYLQAWEKLKNVSVPLSDSERAIYLDKEDKKSYWGQFTLSAFCLVLAVFGYLNYTHNF